MRRFPHLLWRRNTLPALEAPAVSADMLPRGSLKPSKLLLTALMQCAANTLQTQPSFSSPSSLIATTIQHLQIMLSTSLHSLIPYDNHRKELHHAVQN